uniref:Uncharacterized protein n=1 Tax=Rhizophora mucronata TaxID=61149 RepID=A0A2P2Q3Q0_RHIMU
MIALIIIIYKKFIRTNRKRKLGLLGC